MGVCTRPAAVMLNPPWRELKQVNARVALRPTGQSDSERVGRFAADLAYVVIPEAVRERAKHLILDALGITLAVDRLSAVGKVSMKNRLKRLLEENGNG